jgi:GNAT superfamily N-acetyltransferase
MDLRLWKLFDMPRPSEQPASWKVRRASSGDERELADVHLQVFPGFFLTELGARFLRRLYRAFIVSPDGVCLVLEIPGDGGRIAGFAAGALQPASFFGDLRRRQGLAFAVDSLPAVLRHPFRTLRRLARGLRYRGESPGPLPDAALLSSIGVLAVWRGSGASGQLLDAFCAEVARRGRKSVYLTTDLVDNERANSFYQRHGFSLLDSMHRPDGRKMNRFVRALQ